MNLTNLAAEYILRLRKFDTLMINAFTLLMVAAVAGNIATGDMEAVASLGASAQLLALVLGIVAFAYPILEMAGMWAWGRWDLPRVEVRK